MAIYICLNVAGCNVAKLVSFMFRIMAVLWPGAKQIFVGAMYIVDGASMLGVLYLSLDLLYMQCMCRFN